jgi:sulfite exporter TauE/SafE
VMGLAWALLPCGLLGGALALALLASDALRGAAVMASFGLGTAIDLLIAQVALRSLEARLKGAAEGWQRAGIRLAGLMLASMAALALWTIARGQPHPFCGVG